MNKSTVYGTRDATAGGLSRSAVWGGRVHVRTGKKYVCTSICWICTRLSDAIVEPLVVGLKRRTWPAMATTPVSFWTWRDSLESPSNSRWEFDQHMLASPHRLLGLLRMNLRRMVMMTASESRLLERLGEVGCPKCGMRHFLANARLPAGRRP